MTQPLPSGAEIRASLAALDPGQLKALANRCGVPFTTLWKIRSGETKNPGIETVRPFWGALNHMGGTTAAANDSESAHAA